MDGAVSECGAIEHYRLLQAKGRYYTLAELLAGQAWARLLRGRHFATINLAPYNYHRIHMAARRGACRITVYVPGRLFSVNAATASYIPRLFARNERVDALRARAGQFALVLVGALNVGSIATVWAGDITPAKRRELTCLPQTEFSLAKGAELGRFNARTAAGGAVRPPARGGAGGAGLHRQDRAARAPGRPAGGSSTQGHAGRRARGTGSGAMRALRIFTAAAALLAGLLPLTAAAHKESNSYLTLSPETPPIPTRS